MPAHRVAPEIAARVEDLYRQGLTMRGIAKELAGEVSHGGVQGVITRAGIARPHDVAPPLDVQARIVHDITVAGMSQRDAGARNGVSRVTARKYVQIARNGHDLHADRIRDAVAALRPRSTELALPVDQPVFATRIGFANFPETTDDGEHGDGPRHGTERGYLAHIHEGSRACEPCATAAREATEAAYQVRNAAEVRRARAKRRNAEQHAARQRTKRGADPAYRARYGESTHRAFLPARPRPSTDTETRTA